MGRPFFQFKQFKIWHDKCAMKVGTDGVLLGAWARVNHAQSILDIGSGSGLIAMMLAQRSEAEIDAIDPDQGAYEQMLFNVNSSSFSDRICVYRQSLADFTQTANKKYDLIVSNPPYFIGSLQGPDQQRNQARHAGSLTLDSLLRDAGSLLTDNGSLALILPYDQSDLLTSLLSSSNLHKMHETAVIPVMDANPKRLLIQLGKHDCQSYVNDTLTIEKSRHIYTEDYINLTKDFYLKM